MATASTERYSSSISSYFEGEPQRPNVITEIPGPKVIAAREAMSKIQDVNLTNLVDADSVDSSSEYHGVH
jgi:hypothetical protein